MAQAETVASRHSSITIMEKRFRIRLIASPSLKIQTLIVVPAPDNNTLII